MMLAVPVVSTVKAQERYIHLILLWDNTGDETTYNWNMSNIYSDYGIETDKAELEAKFIEIQSIGGAGLVDYFALFGSHGYELISTVNVFSAMMFVFQKPVR